LITYQTLTRDQIESVADFIAALNQDRSEQSGWLGTSQEEIIDALSTLPYIPFEDSHIAAYENGHLVGVFGYFGFPEKGVIRLIGPHVKHPAWLEVTQNLWERLLDTVPAGITTVKGFCDSQNQKCLDFFTGLGMTQYNAEAMMRLNRDLYTPVERNTDPAVAVVEYTQDYESGFRAIHPEFAHTSAQEILGRLSDTKKLFLVTEHGQVRGYTYVETYLETGKSDVVYLLVDEQSRNKRYGSLLMMHVIEWSFAKPMITEVILSVRPENPARRLYLRLGFVEENLICALEKEL